MLVSERTSILESALPGEHRRLVRLCARLTGDVEAAEDLAQETLLEAWRQAHKLYDPGGYAPWLSAIARNVCLRWAQRRGPELPVYEVVAAEGPSHAPTFAVAVHLAGFAPVVGRGGSKRAAEQAAAAGFLEAVGAAAGAEQEEEDGLG